jgi:ABC-type transporter Mla subunit MlaD
MGSRTARDNTLAGLFVASGLALAVWASFMLGERTGLSGVTKLTVRFPIAMGTHGLKPGAAVLLGGQKIGSVKGVGFYPKGSSPTDVDVAVEVPKDIPLTDGSWFTLERPLLGSISTINIYTPDSAPTVPGAPPPELAAKPKLLTDGSVVKGGLAPPALLTQSGFSTHDVENLRHSIQSLDQSLSNISALIDKRTPDLDQSVADVRAMIADFRQRMTPWSDMVGDTLGNAKSASAKLGPIIDQVDGGIRDARAFIKSIQQVVDDNRAHIDNALREVDSAASKLDQKLIDDLNVALNKAKVAVESIDTTIQKVSTLISSESPNVQRVIANLRLMSDNLKLTAIEVRAQPWRALHAPTNKELSTQSMYDATRAYAEASSDLRAASDSLRSLITADTAHLADPAAIAEAGKLLAQSSEKYKIAEQRLLEILIREEKK